MLQIRANAAALSAAWLSGVWKLSLPPQDTSARAGHVQGDDRNNEGDIVYPDLDDRLSEAAPPLTYVPTSSQPSTNSSRPLG